MKKIILLIGVMLIVTGVVIAWDTNPTYDPFELIWNYLANVSTSWVDGSGKVTTNVSVGIGTASPTAKLEVDGDVIISGNLDANVKQLIQDFVVANRIYEKSLKEKFGEEIRLYE